MSKFEDLKKKKQELEEKGRGLTDHFWELQNKKKKFKRVISLTKSEDKKKNYEHIISRIDQEIKKTKYQIRENGEEIIKVDSKIKKCLG